MRKIITCIKNNIKEFNDNNEGVGVVELILILVEKN